MTKARLYHTVADLVLLTHVAFVAFIVVGLILILMGGFLGWNWIRNPWFRILHLAGISLVIAQAWLGIICPLTTLEMKLRESAGDQTYHSTFMAHWLGKLLFFDAPPWVFMVGYTLFGLAVVSSWWLFRPRPIRQQRLIPHPEKHSRRD
jgi:hypothetical protein